MYCKGRCGSDRLLQRALLLHLAVYVVFRSSIDVSASKLPVEIPEDVGLRHQQHGPSSAALVKRLHIFDLTDFGAVGDGVVDNTRAFQNALYAVSGVADKGGGQLYVPPGRFVTGSFNLTSNMTLYLAREAVILGSKNANRWPILAPLPSYGRGRDLPGPRHSSLIYGQNLDDVIITGENGTIDGQGLQWWEQAINGTLNYSRGSLIEVLWTKGLVLSNITLVNSPFWTLHPAYCSGVTIINVTIGAPDDSPNTDGLVPDSCTDVHVAHVYISSGSDAVAIKSGWDEYGIAYGQPSTRVVIRNAVLRAPSGAGFAIGSEMSGGVANITLQDTAIIDSKVGLLIKTTEGRGGYISDIFVRRVAMEGVDTAIQFASDFGEHPDPSYDPNAWPVVRGLSIRHVEGSDIGQAGLLDGLAKSPFQDIVLQDVSLQLRPGGSGFNCAFVGGLAWDVVPEPCPELKPFNSTILLLPQSRDKVGDL